MRHQRGSLTGQLTIEGRQGDGESLHGTQGEAVIHGEDVLGYAAKLHHNVILWMRQQEGAGTQERDTFSSFFPSVSVISQEK